MEQLTRYPFDSIVSDFVLAEYDGFEFLKTIHSLAHPPKVIFITAFASKEMAISLLNLGVHGLLEKPFSVSSLTDLLDKKIENRITKLWRLEPSTRMMTTTSGSFKLTEVEFKVVSYLLSNLGKWISREGLVEQVWGKENRTVAPPGNMGTKYALFSNLPALLVGDGIAVTSWSVVGLNGLVIPNP